MKQTTRTICSTRGRVASLAGVAALGFLLASCTTTTVPCSRVEFGSMGPENSFRVDVPAKDAPVLDTDDDRLGIALTIVPPVDGPVTLVQTVDGREVNRFELKTSVAAGVSVRCGLSFSALTSPCGAKLETRLLSTAGEWSIEAGANRVLEAGLSARVCR